MNLQVKICGMKHNTEAVSALSPDYLGFIFYENSPRNFDGNRPSLPDSIKKVGVFVNATVQDIHHKVDAYGLDVLQLHGDESPEFCQQFRDQLEVWKVFSMGEDFDFDRLQPYEQAVDKFLFDTRSEKRGGSGKKFNWEVFQSYASRKPFVLSGGIGPEDVEALLALAQTSLPVEIIDVNSRFEITPGNKDLDQLNNFLEALQRQGDSV